jgi:hypothetical protein
MSGEMGAKYSANSNYERMSSRGWIMSDLRIPT